MLCYTTNHAMLHNAVLWICFMLRYSAIHYAMLHDAMLCYALFYYAMLCYAMLCYAMLCYTFKIASIALLLLRHNFLRRQLFLCTESLLGSECTKQANTVSFLFNKPLICPNPDFCGGELQDKDTSPKYQPKFLLSRRK